MGYPVKAVANAILQIAEQHGASISPLKLQKLVYISHGWNLGLTGQPLIVDELAEAWQYGPVFPSLYQEFKQFGRGPIKGLATDLAIADDWNFEVVKPQIPDDDTFAWQLLRKVWNEYGKFGAIALSDLTHKAATPWDQTREKSGGIKNADIKNDLIEDHYKQLVANPSK